MELTKPRLTSLAVMATLVGYGLGVGAVFEPAVLFATFIGAWLVGGGVNALNQYLERGTDARMSRTSGRPLPAGRLAPEEALCFGSVTAAAGVGYLALTVNPLTGAIALAIVLSYLFVYTPLKRVSPLSTAAGAVSGALPMVMGWAAAGREITPVGWALFAIVFVWQFPHFFAICWLHREDYARAGCPMLPVRDRTGVNTAVQSTLLCLLLVPVTLLPTWLGLTGRVYVLAAVAVGLVLAGFGLAWAVRPSRSRARRMVVASVVYLPLLMVFMLVDKAG
ncbi:MAG: heme o synthase [Planctomycetota bacterium]